MHLKGKWIEVFHNLIMDLDSSFNYMEELRGRDQWCMIEFSFKPISNLKNKWQVQYQLMAYQ